MFSLPEKRGKFRDWYPETSGSDHPETKKNIFIIIIKNATP